MATTTSLVIDTDTGSDDAVALLMAARLPDVDLRAVSTVAGNVPIDFATRNAQVTLELAGRSDVPVHVGAAKPLMRTLSTAQHVHGVDGMSGVSFPDPTAAVDQVGAVEALLRISRDEPGRHTLVTLGPLTNIALAVSIDPEFLTRFEHVVAMAGAFDGVGNVHRVGEFNVWADPEAAKIAIDAPGLITFLGWDMSRQYAVVTPDEQAALRGLGRFGEFAVDINRCVDEFVRVHNGLAGYDLPDPLAMAVAIDPDVVTARRSVHLDVSLDEAGRGGTFIDHRQIADEPNATIVTSVDEARFKSLVTAACTEA